MNELIENITNNNFEKAKSIFFNNDLKRMHEAITEAAYTSGDEVFGKFYDYLLVNDSNNANLHYCIAELYTTVFNILPGGYEKAFKHAQKAIELAEDDLNDLKKRVKSEGYNEGQVAGVEMAVKKGREKFGLDFEGKNLDNFAEALKTKTLADAKVEPEKRVREANEKLERLQGTYDTDLRDRDSKIADLESQLKNLSINEKLISSAIPKDLQGLTPKDFLVVARSRGYSSSPCPRAFWPAAISASDHAPAARHRGAASHRS